MKYEYIDPDAVDAQTMEQDAQEYESRATMMEYEALRLEVLGNTAGAKAMKAQAELARKEADAFADASGFSEDRLKVMRDTGVTNILGMVETQHKQAARRHEVRQAAGLPSAGHDNQMEELERIKDAVTAKFRPTETKKSAPTK